jgi:hypothetical protein
LYAKIRSLRQGERVIGPWEGGEALGRKPGVDGGPSVHEFLFRSKGVGKDLLRPRVNINLYTGVNDDEDSDKTLKPSLSDDETVALWDKLTSSIRARPVKENRPRPDGETPESETKPEAAAPEAEDFPRRIATGDACPKRGHWRCVEDGHRYNFVVGQVMPNATFEEPATGFFNRLMGKRLYRDGPGHWEWAEETPPAETRG